MFDIGFGEILFFGIIVIIVLGPERLPEAIRFLARLRSKFITFKQHISSTLENELELNQLKNELNLEISNVKELELKLQKYLAELNEGQILPQHRYYAVDDFETYIPFNNKFVLEHLMSWSCFHLDIGKNLEHQEHSSN